MDTNLTPAQQDLLEIIALFQRPVSIELVCGAANNQACADDLNQLASHQLIILDSDKVAASTELAGSNTNPQLAQKVIDFGFEQRWLKDLGDLEEHLELHRMALYAMESAIAWEIGDVLANHFLNNGDPASAIEICQTTLAAGDDYGILHTLALAWQMQGDDDEASNCYEQALILAQQDTRLETLNERASLLSHFAELLSSQGGTFRAQSLWQQARALFKDAGNHFDEAQTLSLMGNSFATAEKYDQAQTHWEMALTLFQHEEPSWEMATLLSNMAMIRHKLGDAEKSWHYHQQCAETLMAIEAWAELAVMLNKLAQQYNSRSLLAQALVIGFEHEETPIEVLVNASANLLNRLEQKAEDTALVMAANLCQVEARMEGHPRRPELHHQSITMLLRCANHQGVHETRVRDWMNDYDYENMESTRQRAVDFLKTLIDDQDRLIQEPHA